MNGRRLPAPPGMDGLAGSGRADLHIHSRASDGIGGVAEILDHVQANTTLDVIAITDHERVDAALAGRAMAADRGLRFEVVVGEEITTRGGHLLGLYLERPVKPLQSLRSSIARVHEQGGLAIPAHPLVPFPLCAKAGTLRRLVEDPDQRVRPDGLEVFNPTTAGRPWYARVEAFAREMELAGLGNSDAHLPSQIGQGWTCFEGRTASDLRTAIASRRTSWHGTFYPAGAQLVTFLQQLRKYGIDVRDEFGGLLGGRRTGRDLGYPGGRRRPATFDEVEARSGR